MSVAIASNTVTKRYDFVYLFDVKDGNPNGDPDFDNTPRFDPETFQGLVSDVCLKRKIRDYVFAAKSQNGVPQKGYDIYVLQGSSLEERQKKPYTNLAELEDKAKGKDTDPNDVDKARRWMCENFFDVRAFGAVMSVTQFRCGQVRGPVQLTFARSFDRVLSSEHGITRVAYTTEAKKTEKASGSGEMGHKHTVAYGLYRAHGFINPHFATRTVFTEEDLGLLWNAMANMLGAFDASAARGLMAARHLFVFEHASALGEAPAHKLFDLIRVGKRTENGEEVETPRSYEDYIVPSLEEIRKGLPAGVTVTDKLN